jgi:hypothetical protein
MGTNHWALKAAIVFQRLLLDTQHQSTNQEIVFF